MLRHLHYIIYLLLSFRLLVDVCFMYICQNFRVLGCRATSPIRNQRSQLHRNGDHLNEVRAVVEVRCVQYVFLNSLLS